MEQMEPMISGSSAPRVWAVKNQGSTKDSEATSVRGIMPFKALSPWPQMITIRNGERNVRRH